MALQINLDYPSAFQAWISVGDQLAAISAGCSAPMVRTMGFSQSTKISRNLLRHHLAP
jgi:hypothetical protein